MENREKNPRHRLSILAKRKYREYEKFLNTNGLTENNILKVFRDIYLQKDEFEDFVSKYVIIKMISYLINRGVDFTKLDECIMNYIHLSTPKFLKKSISRFKVLNEISRFCYNYGAICILSTGDVIDNNKHLYKENEESITYNEFGRKNYWRYNAFNFTIDGSFKKVSKYFYGFFILPNGKAFICYFSDRNECRFINLKKIESITNTGKISLDKERTITISEEGEITLKNGIKFAPEKRKDIDENVSNLLINGMAPMICDFICHGDPTEYVNYKMRYLAYVDKTVYDDIYKNEKRVLKFLSRNFCIESLDIAIEYLQKTRLQDQD